MALRVFRGGALFGEASGELPARVLALHGWGRRGSDFSQSLQGLDYIALDLPGFGAAPPPPRAMGAVEYARFISPILDDLCPSPLVVGHSFGGRVAVSLAASHPDRVGGLVLTGVPLLRTKDRTGPRLGYRLVRWGHRHHLISDERMELARRRYGSDDYRKATGVMRETLVRVVNESYEAELAELRVPVYLLWGAADREVPATVAREAASVLSRAGTPVKLRLVHGVGHWLPTEDPQALRGSVEEMLETRWT